MRSFKNQSLQARLLKNLWNENKVKKKVQLENCNLLVYVINLPSSCFNLINLGVKPHHYTIKWKWSPHLTVLEKHTNLNNFNDENLDLKERVITVEDTTWEFSKVEPLVSTTLITDIKGKFLFVPVPYLTHIVAWRLIAWQMKMNGFCIKKATYYFRINRDNNLWLLFASGIQSEAVEEELNYTAINTVKHTSVKFLEEQKEVPKSPLWKSFVLGKLFIYIL